MYEHLSRKGPLKVLKFMNDKTGGTLDMYDDKPSTAMFKFLYIQTNVTNDDKYTHSCSV